MHLSAGDIAALEHANTVLLSPFAFESAMAWRRAACLAVEACIGGDGSSYALPVAGEPMIAASLDGRRVDGAPACFVAHGRRLGRAVRRQHLAAGTVLQRGRSAAPPHGAAHDAR